MEDPLEPALRDATSVLFLCSGNMIRSAFAELYARHLACALPVRSAATRYVNTRIHPAAAEALRSRGVAREAIEAFRPSQLWNLERELDPKTLVLGMTREHVAALARPELVRRAFLLPHVLGRAGEIEDPLVDGGYARAFAALEGCVDRLVERLARDAG